MPWPINPTHLSPCSSTWITAGPGPRGKGKGKGKADVMVATAVAAMLDDGHARARGLWCFCRKSAAYERAGRAGDSWGTAMAARSTPRHLPEGATVASVFPFAPAQRACEPNLPLFSPIFL